MTRRYAVKEVFPTLQGEGTHAGRPAVFVRFAGCNLWSGRTDDRSGPACAQWCDTAFVGTDGENGGRYDADELTTLIDQLWRSGERPFVVLTGGEPTLQVDDALRNSLWEIDAVVAIETNGTTDTDLSWLDHVCVSPKGDTKVLRDHGQELKLIHGQPEAGAQPEVWEARAAAEESAFDRYYLQPMEPLQPGTITHGTQWRERTQATIEYVRAHPFWRLSLQVHKLVNLP